MTDGEPDGTAAPTDERTAFAQFEREASGEHAPATDTDEGDIGENGTDAVEGEGEAQTKGKSVQERMNEITAARREAEREREEARREAEYWKGLADGKKPADEPKGDAAANADGDPEPDPEKYEYGEADARFIRDSARWNARAEFREQQRQVDEKAQFAELRRGYDARVAEAAEKYPDYADKVQAAADRGEWPCTQVMALAIMSSPVGPDVANHLATTKEEAARIAGLSTLEQAREMGRLEGRFSNQPKEAAPKAEATKAPPPPTHQARGAGGKFEIDDDTADFAAFEAKYSRDNRRK